MDNPDRLIIPVLALALAFAAGSHARAESAPTGGKGFHYAEILRHVEEVTGDLKSHFPDYSGEGYGIAGFGWHQGWNDRINQQAVDAYEDSE